MIENLKKDFHEEINKIVKESSNSRLDIDVNPSVIGSLLFHKLKSLSASQASIDEFACIIKENPNNFVEAMGSAMLTMVIEDALKCMIEIETKNKKEA